MTGWREYKLHPAAEGLGFGVKGMQRLPMQVDTAKRGESVAMKIEATNSTEATRLYGRHFDFKVRPGVGLPVMTILMLPLCLVGSSHAVTNM